MLDCRLFERGRPPAGAGAGRRAAARPGAASGGAERRAAVEHAARPRSRARCGFGVPYDIIGSFVPAILRRFAKAQPRVRVSLVCEDSKVVRQQLRSGGVDLALTTETDCGRHGETLRTDRLVWVGVPGGDAHLKDPLPVSLGAPTCVFRPGGDRGAGQGAARLARGLRGEPARAGACRDRGGAGGGAAAALLGAGTFRDPGPRRPGCRRCRSSASTSMLPPGASPAARDLADHVRALVPWLRTGPPRTIDTKPNWPCPRMKQLWSPARTGGPDAVLSDGSVKLGVAGLGLSRHDVGHRTSAAGRDPGLQSAAPARSSGSTATPRSPRYGTKTKAASRTSRTAWASTQQRFKAPEGASAGPVQRSSDRARARSFFRLLRRRHTCLWSK